MYTVSYGPLSPSSVSGRNVLHPRDGPSLLRLVVLVLLRPALEPRLLQGLVVRGAARKYLGPLFAGHALAV